MNPSWVAGIDGSRRGWFVVLVSHAQGRVIETRHHVCCSFEEIFKPPPASFWSERMVSPLTLSNHAILQQK